APFRCRPHANKPCLGPNARARAGGPVSRRASSDQAPLRRRRFRKQSCRGDTKRLPAAGRASVSLRSVFALQENPFRGTTPSPTKVGRGHRLVAIQRNAGSTAALRGSQVYRGAHFRVRTETPAGLAP